MNEVEFLRRLERTMLRFRADMRAVINLRRQMNLLISEYDSFHAARICAEAEGIFVDDRDPIINAITKLDSFDAPLLLADYIILREALGYFEEKSQSKILAVHGQ